MGIRISSRRVSLPRSVTRQLTSITMVRLTYSLPTAFEYSVAIEVFVVFYCVGILDDTFGATERWWGATMHYQHCIVTQRQSTYSSDVSAL